MPIGTLHEGISVDFADVLLIINIFAIAMLLGVLYINEIAASTKRLAHALNPSSLYQRLRLWLVETRATH